MNSYEDVHFRPMRVLMINWFDWTHPLWGGAEVYLRETARRLVARGHDVWLIASTYAGCAGEEVLDGVRVVRRGHFWTYAVELPWHYRRLVRERGAFDVVVEYTNKVPLLAPWWAGCPVVAVAHHLWGRAIFAESALPVATAVWASESLIPLAYRRVPWLAVSPSTRDALVARGIEAQAIALAPNGIAIPNGPAWPAWDGAPRVVWVGRVRTYKRLDLLLRAMAHVRTAVPHASLDVVGDGPALSATRALATALGLTDGVVTFHGAIGDAARDAVVGRAALVAQPSLIEGWGRTVLEAAVLGVPSVVANVPGLRDAVVDGQTGTIVDGDRPESFGEAIVRMVTDRAFRARLGRRAADHARGFGWEAATDATEAALTAAVQGSMAPPVATAAKAWRG